MSVSHESFPIPTPKELQEMQENHQPLAAVEDQAELGLDEAATTPETEDISNVIPIDSRSTAATPQAHTGRRGHRRATRPAGPPSYEGMESHAQPEPAPAGAATRQSPMGGRFVTIDQKVYSNGARHVYGIDAEGKRRHLSHDEILEYYGHAGEYGKDQVVAETSPAPVTGKHRKVENTPIYDSMTGKVASEDYVGRHRKAEATPIYDTMSGKSANENYTGRHLKDDNLAHVRIYGPDRLPISLAETPMADVVSGESEPVRLEAEASSEEDGFIESVLQEGVTDMTPQGLRSRVKRIFSKTRGALSDLYAKIGARQTLATGQVSESLRARLKDYYKDEEYGRRRKVASVAAGAVAVAGMYLAAKQGYSMLHHGQEVVPTPSGTVSGAHLGDFPVNGHEVLNGAAMPKFEVHSGDMPWDVLHNAGVPNDEIMSRLDEAAKDSGLPYQWHGSGQHRWLEVAGKSDTKSVMNALSEFIKK